MKTQGTYAWLGRGRRGFWAWLPLVLSLLVVTVGCEGTSFLDVENEQDLLDRELDSPAGVGPVLAGVAGDFAVAYDNGAIITGLLAQEFIHTGSFPSWRAVGDLGRGSRPSSNGNGMYNDFSRAVWVAGDAVRRFRGVLDSPDTSPEVAGAMIWGGYALLFLADNYCNATFDAGPPVSPAQVYAMAEARLDSAAVIAQAAGDQELALAAIGGRGRARLFQEDYAGALADVQQIPDGFEFLALYSDNSGREYNDPANMMRTETRREAGVHPRYYESDVYVNDPRVPFTNFGPDVTGPQATRQFVQQEKYPSRGSDISVLNWEEARLMEAEAELRLGDVERAVELIDALRTRAGVELEPYDGPVTEEAVFEQLLYERSAELWLQGRLLKDMVRSGDPLMQGRDTCFEIGQDEWETNPNLGGGG